MTSIYARCCRITLALMALSAPALIYGAWQTLQVNANSPIDWVSFDFPARQDYERFRSSFESGDVIVVSWPGCSIDDERLDTFERRLDSSPDARDSNGNPYFSNVLTTTGTIREMTSPPLSLSTMEAASRLRGSLVGQDGRSACGIVVCTSDGLRDRAQAVALVQRILADDCKVPVADQHLAGPIIDGLSVDRASFESLNRFAGPSSLLILLLTWRCLRSWRTGLAVFVIATYCQFASLAAVHFCGEAMNAVLMVMPPLVLVLGVSGGIHLVNYLYDAINHEGREGAAARAVRLGWLPCALSSGTTALGLASLLVSDLKPIRQFGFYGALGVVATFVLLFLVLPGAFEIWPKFAASARNSDHGPSQVAWQSWVVGVIRRRSKLIVAVSTALMIVTAVGATKIRTSVRIQTLFASDSRILEDYRWIEERVVPLVPIEVLVHVGHQCPLSVYERLELVRQVEARLAHLPEVQGTLSATDFTPSVAESGGARQSVTKTIVRRKLEQNLDRFVELGYLAKDPNAQHWRVTARVSSIDDIDYGLFLAEVRAAVEPLVDDYRQKGVDHISVTYTGVMPLVHEIQRGLVHDLFNSFLSAMVVITLTMIAVEREIVAGLVSMVPNFFPIVLLFGAMGWLGRPMDIGSVMTASIALGMAIDGTLHYLTFYRREIERTDSPPVAVEAAFTHCAAAMVESTVVCGFGLMPFALSAFLPTGRFAWMILGLLWAALAGGLIVLPALLLGHCGRFFRRKKSSVFDSSKSSKS